MHNIIHFYIANLRDHPIISLLRSRRPQSTEPLDRVLHIDREQTRPAHLHFAPQHCVCLRPRWLWAALQPPHVR